MYIGTGADVPSPDGWETWNDDAAVGYAGKEFAIIHLHTAVCRIGWGVALSDEF
jgi:hypothetical protein